MERARPRVVRRERLANGVGKAFHYSAVWQHIDPDLRDSISSSMIMNYIRKKQVVKQYPQTYENVSAYVSFHTFF